jgi:C_GCAxxG_C_C family probable redox protein
MSRAAEAREIFHSRYNCAQTVLSLFSEAYGLDKKTACRLACAFGAGIGRTGNICGAVNGAILAISLSVDYGATNEERMKGKDTAYALTREFMKRFSERHGSIVCKELLRCDLATPEGSQLASEQRLFETLCPDFVEGAVLILEGLLQGREKER